MEIIKEKVKWAFSAEKELEKSLKLLPQEKINYKKRSVVIFRILQSPGFVVLTNKRLIFLMHFPFSPDKIWYIPLEKISKVRFRLCGFLRAKARAIEVDYGKKETIDFAVDLFPKMLMTGLTNPKETKHFLDLLKKELPKEKINENETLTRNDYDYYLLIIGFFVGGFIFKGLLSILIFGLIGYLIGKGINKILK